MNVMLIFRRWTSQDAKAEIPDFQGQRGESVGYQSLIDTIV